MKGDSVAQAIIKTLVYADIFDYPLQLTQLHNFLIANKKISQGTIRDVLMQMPDLVQEKDGYYFLSGRRRIVFTRKQREQHSRNKIRKAQMVASILFLFPAIQFIGISGNVAVENAQKGDDIDFFVITQAGTLWVTRLFSTMLLDMLGFRRKRGSLDVEDKICLNMFIDQSGLSTPKQKQDVYIAHEIAQVVPLVDRQQTYRKFLKANTWILKYLPNFTDKNHGSYITREKKSVLGIILRLILANGIVEWFAAVAQRFYMRSHKTNEITSQTMLAFHPRDYHNKVLLEYNKRIKQIYEI